ESKGLPFCTREGVCLRAGANLQPLDGQPGSHFWKDPAERTRRRGGLCRRPTSGQFPHGRRGGGARHARPASGSHPCGEMPRPGDHGDQGASAALCRVCTLQLLRDDVSHARLQCGTGVCQGCA
ncbi:unnamed protein product, partial [Symbiodinium microadriaticum]